MRLSIFRPKTKVLKNLLKRRGHSTTIPSDKAMTLENYFIWKNVLTSSHFGFLCFCSLVATLHFLVKTTTTATRPPNFFFVGYLLLLLSPLVFLPCLYWDQFGWVLNLGHDFCPFSFSSFCPFLFAFSFRFLWETLLYTACKVKINLLTHAKFQTFFCFTLYRRNTSRSFLGHLCQGDPHEGYSHPSSSTFQRHLRHLV